MSFGGQESGGSQQSQSTGGFQALSPEIKAAFNDLATKAQSYIPGTTAGGGTSNLFTPLQQTAGETQAIGDINKGFSPTASTLKSDIGMQMNPFDSSVISDINRRATGANSVLNQSLSKAGQFGSNRAALGANDIDLSRLNQIGQFEQGQYNNSLNNALTTLPGLRQQDANNRLSAGGFQRSLAGQTNQAPLTSLQTIAQILGILPTNSSQSSSSGSQSAGGFNFGLRG